MDRESLQWWNTPPTLPDEVREMSARCVRPDFSAIPLPAPGGLFESTHREPMNILLVDDHALFRQGFALTLARLWDEPIRVVEAASAESGLASVAAESFDLIFLDLGLPGLGGMEGLHALRKVCPTTCLVVLSALRGAGVVRQALLLGAQGYIPKTVSVDTLRDALRQILDGRVYTPIDAPGSDVDQRAEDMLTGRQVDVLAELCAGSTNREIAERLGMSENTVRVHATAVFRQLGVRSRTEAVLLAKRKGWF